MGIHSPPKMYVMFVAASLFWLCCPLSQAENMPISTEEEIDYLLNRIQTSECIFIRNRKEYPGEKAVEHIQLKYDHYKKIVQTAEDFIYNCAERSIITGRYYYIQCQDQPQEKLTEWLLKQLEAYRAEQQQQPAKESR